jgi:WD40 repeat protein
VSSADGLIRAFQMKEKLDWKPSEALDSSPLQLSLTHVLLPDSDCVYPPKDNLVSLGSKCIDAIRNYTGEDLNAGSEVIASLRLDGKVSIWTREEQPVHVKDDDVHGSILVRPTYEFHIPDAVGTTMALLPPTQTGFSKDGVCMLVGCLDGSVTMFSTGVPMPSTLKGETPPLECGRIMDKVGEGNTIPTAMALHPFLPYSFAVGRKDGSIDLFTTVTLDDMNSFKQHSYGSFRRIHRLIHSAGVLIRALSYTRDGGLLLVGNDDGNIFLYDTSSPKQKTVRLVGSILEAHKGFILSITSLPDSKRFVTSSVDATVKVWNVASPYSGAIHTFDAGHVDMIWAVASSPDGRRCVSCGDDGLIQVYSCE